MTLPALAIGDPSPSAPGDVGRRGYGAAVAAHDHVHPRTSESAGGGVTSGQIPVGKKDTHTAAGTTDTWNLSFIPETDTLHVYNGAAVLVEDTDYTLAQKTVALTGGIAAGDGLVGRYLYTTDAQPSSVASLRASSGANNGAGASSFNITIPAGAVVGDFMLLAVSHRVTTIPSTPTGWHYYNESPSSGGTRPVRQTVFWRWCQAGDAGTNVSIGFGASNVSDAVLMCYQSIHPTFPISTSGFRAAAADATTFSGPTCAPDASALAVDLFGLIPASGTDPGALTLDPALTSRRSDNYGPSNTNAFVVGEELVGAGTTASRSLTSGNSTDVAGFVVALNDTALPTPSTSAYLDAVLADSPQALYMLGETSGTQMTDSSGHGRHGSYASGRPTTIAGLINSATANLAAAFTNGGTKHGIVPFASWMELTTMTIEYWIQNTQPAGVTVIDRTNGVWTALCSAGGDGGCRPSFAYYSDASHVYGPGGGGPAYLADVQTAYARKHHVVLTLDGTTVCGYVNGSLHLAQSTYPAVWGGSGTGDLRIPDGTGKTIQAVALYSGALSAARVQAHYAAAMAS